MILLWSAAEFLDHLSPTSLIEVSVVMTDQALQPLGKGVSLDLAINPGQSWVESLGDEDELRLRRRGLWDLVVGGLTRAEVDLAMYDALRRFRDHEFMLCGTGATSLLPRLRVAIPKSMRMVGDHVLDMEGLRALATGAGEVLPYRDDPVTSAHWVAKDLDEARLLAGLLTRQVG